MRRRLDKYMTPALLVKRLHEVERISGNIIEPCVGSGILEKFLLCHDCSVVTNDIDLTVKAMHHLDATWKNTWDKLGEADWIVTNPPFTEAAKILEYAWMHCTIGVSLLLRITFLEPTKNRDDLLINLSEYMSSLIIFGQPRPSFTGTGTDTATVAWYTFRKSKPIGTRVIFMPRWGEV